MADRTDEVIAFAEKLLLLLDQGAFTATYKFAVLLAMIDLCLERTAEDGRAPDAFSAQQLAEKTVELYWPQTGYYAGGRGALVLRQNSGGQAAIITAIRDLRGKLGDPPTASRARILDPEGFAQLVAEVEWKLVEMPLPRLQVIGRDEEHFLYRIGWGTAVRRRAVSSGEVDTAIRLQPGVGEMLVRLSGLLRPLIQRQWAERVARFNRSDVAEYELEGFLFGVPRTTPARIVGDLRDLQADGCFYCADRLDRSVEVDHFIPWSRHPDDGIENLVVAHPRCNGAKRDFLAATDHVERWDDRLHRDAADLEEIAASERWPSHAERTDAVVRAIYLRLREDARLWLNGRKFVPPDLHRLSTLLTRGDSGHEQAAENPARYD